MPRKIKILITTAFALCLGITQALAADFTGRWEGRWDARFYSSLTVTDAEASNVKYCWNGWCRSRSADTLSKVRIENGTLYATAGRGDLAFNLDGETLNGTYTAHKDGTVSTIKMTRAPEGEPSNHTMADFVGKWTGRWKGSGKGTLTVTEGDPFKVKFCFNGNCRSKGLKNVRMTEGDLWFDWSGSMQFSVEGDVLHSTYTNRSGAYTTTMTRKAP